MKTTTKRTTQKPKPAAPSNLGAPPAPPDLNMTQEMVIDAVLDMLAHGGQTDDIEKLLYAAMSH